MSNIILSGFDGKNNSARIVTEKISFPCDKLILPNDREKSAEMLLKTIKEKNASCVVVLGQKPLIKDKIAVEPTAKKDGDMLHTTMDCTVTKEIIERYGCKAYISKGCGNSYCNSIYYECLKSGINCIFLHIPSVDNISDKAIVIKAIEGYLSELGQVPCML
ncbi:MAG: hypothetical protein IJZ65_05700 [Ruminiclostridium sp.]|nr:hypothetical protein [Ruminiclostridium sp.]